MRQTAPTGGSPGSQADLVALAGQLGARNVSTVSRSETSLLACAAPISGDVVRCAADGIARGEDPLGAWFERLRSPLARRAHGATYTPDAMVARMLEWAMSKAPARVLDAGTGSGRFLVAAGRRFPDAELVGIEIDPLAALLARGHLASAGLASRSRVIRGSYLDLRLSPPPRNGPTLFVGNPPYVRHHDTSAAEKRWLARAGEALGIKLSGLSSSYVHFIAKTALIARPGDAGVFVTAAEWLKTNYGRALLELWSDRLGLVRLHVLDATVLPFEGALTTAAVACFEVGRKPGTIWVRRERDLDRMQLSGGRRVAPDEARRVLHGRASKGPADWVPLGELCRVHRGQVTGSNDVWIADSACSLPEALLFPAITRARELFATEGLLVSAHGLRRVIDLPVDLDDLDATTRRAVARFLSRARAAGAHRTYIAAHRRPWWRVGLREPAPILATYMARRPPVFVRNLAGVRHINIAHGLYPRVSLSQAALDALARHLTASTTLGEGRAYAGGLVKFEPREMERLRVPPPEALERDGSGQERRDVDARPLVVEARRELGRPRVIRVEGT